MRTANETCPQLTDYFELKSFKDSFKNIRADSVVNNTKLITVFEHQRLTVSDFSQAADFDWLLTQEFTVFSLKRQSGQWQLKVGHYVGIIVLPSGMTLEILPKPISASDRINSSQDPKDIAVTRLWVQQMLNDLFHKDCDRQPHYKTLGQLSGDVEALIALPVQTLPISEWLIKQFMQLIVLYKPTQAYQTVTQNHASLQGKLLIKEQLRHNGAQPHKFVSEVSYLSQQTLSNRLIKSALNLLEPLLAQSLSSPHSSLATALSTKYLSAWRGVSAFNTYELRQLSALYKSAKTQLTIQSLSRSQLYIAQQLLDWAYWLLGRQQASLQTGSSLTSNPTNNTFAAPNPPRLCLLFNMNQAFEQWASLRITMMFAQLNTDYQIQYQAQHSWLRDRWGQNCLSIRPDLLVGQHTLCGNNDNTGNDNTSNDNASADNRSVLTYSHVIDIKWKALAQANAISASDAYQLTSYAQAYQAAQVWLVYPVTDHTRQPVALQQHCLASHLELTDSTQLWLMPFNVLTATLNDWQAATKSSTSKN